jgi:hypothetical protein
MIGDATRGGGRMADLRPGMDWPPGGDEDKYGPWLALADGAELRAADGAVWRLSVVDCGELVLPTGRLGACDPFSDLERSPEDPSVEVPPGSYPVRVTLADVSGKGDGSHIREAYASLLLGGDPEVRRAYLFGFGVDAGTACLVDAGTVMSAMPPRERGSGPDDWRDSWDAVFTGYGQRRAKRGSWVDRMDDRGHIRDGIANVVLPLARAGENIILIHSGWGDGGYPVVGGYDAAGTLVAVHVDLFVVASAGDPDA